MTKHQIIVAMIVAAFALPFVVYAAALVVEVAGR